MCKLHRCVSELSEIAINTMDMIDTTDMTDWMELQLESHDEVNYKIVEFEMIFTMIQSSFKQNSNGEVMHYISGGKLLVCGKIKVYW